MTKRIDSLEVIENNHLTKEIFTIELRSESDLPEIKPGQFIQVKVEGSQNTFLRRPFSVHEINYSKKTLNILVRIMGKGTEALSALIPGDRLNIIYPLGNSFTLPKPGDHCLLVGGGCGVAPLLYLGRYLKEQGTIPDILLGFRNRELMTEYSKYEKIGRVFLTTEDGSAGEKGLVTDHPALHTYGYNKVYCCGPETMMRSVAAYCRKNHIDCEVSLENLMGCGIGVCLCCVTETVNGNVCTCTDGPVFNIKDLRW